MCLYYICKKTSADGKATILDKEKKNEATSKNYYAMYGIASSSSVSFAYEYERITLVIVGK